MSSCKLFYPDIMFKTKKDFVYTPLDSAKIDQFMIKPGDYLEVKVFSNNGYNLVDVRSFINYDINGWSIPYVVRKNGFVNMPLLDSLNLSGLTIPEAENLLAQKYSYYFVNPYVRVSITNNFVSVFTGRGIATTVPFVNNDMTLIEAIANAHGIDKSAKSYKIKLVRGTGAAQKVFLIDLSGPDGFQYASLDLAPDDIIYVEPAFSTQELMVQISPVITLITTLGLLYYNLFVIH